METISTVDDCQILTLNTVFRKEGRLTIVENQKDIPFDIQRVYYIYGVGTDDARGHHAHKTLKQLIIAISGDFYVVLRDGSEQRNIHLNKPGEGLLVVPGIWRDLMKFSNDAVCLVLASQLYDEQDYIRNYTDFLKYRNGHSTNSQL